MPIGQLYSISSPQPVRMLFKSDNEGGGRRNNAINLPLSNAVSGVGSKHLYATCKLNKWGNAFEGLSAITKKNNLTNSARTFSSKLVTVTSKSAANQQPTANQERRSRNLAQLINFSSRHANENIAEMVVPRKADLSGMHHQFGQGLLVTIDEDGNMAPVRTMDSVMPVAKNFESERKIFMQNMLSDGDDTIVLGQKNRSTYYPAQECVCAESDLNTALRKVACPLDVLKENVEEMSEDVEQRSIQSDSAYESTDDLRNMDEHVNVSNQQSFVKQEQDDPRIHADTVMSYMQSTAYMYVAPLPPDVLNSTLQAIKSRSNDGVDEEVFLVERTFLEKCSCIATQLDDRDAPEDDWDTQEDNVDHLHLKNGLAENLNVAYVRKVLGDWTRKQFKYLPRIM